VALRGFAAEAISRLRPRVIALVEEEASSLLGPFI
jgi:hypothetical protein